VSPFRILTFTAPPDGGYETLIALALSPDIFVCGVDLAGPASLVTLIALFLPQSSTIRFAGVSFAKNRTSRSGIFREGSVAAECTYSA